MFFVWGNPKFDKKKRFCFSKFLFRRRMIQKQRKPVAVVATSKKLQERLNKALRKKRTFGEKRADKRTNFRMTENFHHGWRWAQEGIWITDSFVIRGYELIYSKAAGAFSIRLSKLVFKGEHAHCEPSERMDFLWTLKLAIHALPVPSMGKRGQKYK